MDTTAQNIEMCRKATEVQQQWKPTEGDFVYCGNDRTTYILNAYANSEGEGHRVTEHGYAVPFADFGEHVWLPRQDELQEMVELRVHDLQSLAKWARCVELEYETWEQFLLAYVMLTKYGKTWDGKEWVKR